MIKAEELMIGNYVEYVGEICQVISVSNSYCTIGTRFPRGSMVPRNIPLEYINPIAITGEILLKFEFENKKFKIFKTSINYVIKGMIIFKCDDMFICDKTGTSIKSVHQLQNHYFALNQKHLTFIK